MAKKYLVFFVGLLLNSSVAWSQLATVMVDPTVAIGVPEQTISFDIRVSSAESIGAMQFTLEYDASFATYQGATLDASMPPGFNITNINANLPSGPFSPGTTDNVLVQLSGNGISDFFTGDQIVVVMTFQLQPGACGSSPMRFEPTCQRTHLATLGLLPICDPALMDGSLSVDCPTDSPLRPRGRLQLLQNVPNPFNPSTTIRFDLPVAGKVQLRIFDVTGHLVRILFDGTAADGINEVEWDGHDDAGNELSSGMYYYQVKTATETATRRTLMVK